MTGKAGHKIEEREHVFNKTSHKFLKGAQGLKILCLSFMVFGSLVTVVQAQPTPLYAARPSADDNVMARMEVRLQEMERQIQNLTGRVEEQTFEINRLKTQKRILEESASAAASAPALASPQMDASALKLNLTPPQSSGIKTVIPGGGNLTVTSQYEQAFAHLKSDNYEAAKAGFESFLKETPDHSLAPNARYWLGETYYAQGEFKTAARVFAEGFQAFPQSAKSPDILLKLGMSLAQLGKNGDACVALGQIPVKFPAGPEGVLQRGEIERQKLECES